MKGTELKYTDRDVRENPDFEEVVLEYLSRYQGEFDYLVDMKMRHAAGMDLTVGMIRGVLNCMRHDPREKNLPTPLPPEEGVVVQMQRQRKTKLRPEPCPLMAAGTFHHHNRMSVEWHQKYLYCSGLYRINRETFFLPIHTKPDLLAVGRSAMTRRVHRVEFGSMTWTPPAHKYGPAQAVPHYKTACKYPSVLKNPFILFDKHIDEYNESLDEVGYDKAEEWKLDEALLFKCERCFSGE